MIGFWLLYIAALCLIDYTLGCENILGRVFIYFFTMIGTGFICVLIKD